jgi:hypothetical protein
METSGMTGTSNFVILEDRSVWWWRQNVGLGTVVAWLVGVAALGAGLGVWPAVMFRRSKMGGIGI